MSTEAKIDKEDHPVDAASEMSSPPLVLETQMNESSDDGDGGGGDDDDNQGVAAGSGGFDDATTSTAGGGTGIQIDSSMTPKAALLDGTEGLDYEILPDDEVSFDDEDDDDDDAEADDDEEDNEDFLDGNPKKVSFSFEEASGKIPNIGSASPPLSPSSSRDDEDGAIAASPNSTQRRRFPSFKTPRSPRSSSHRSSLAQSSEPSDDTKTNSVAVGASTSTSARTGESSEKPRRAWPLFRNIGLKTDMSMSQQQQQDDMIDDQDSSSDESSYDGDEEQQWMEGEAQLFDLEDNDLPQTSDWWTSLNDGVPLSFLGLPPDVYDYLDTNLVKNVTTSLDTSTFASEHHLFVRGLLQLLAERDHIGVEEEEVRKVGVLRKKHAKSGWRFKYLEVRKGNLTYFADKEHEERRMVHLRKRSCVCRTLPSSKEGQGEELVFELIVDGGRRLLWMAKSEEECQGWVKAIKAAMIGETEDTCDVPLDLNLYQNAIDVYRTVQMSMKDITSRQDCLVAINSLLYRQTSSSALRVPMKWIRENVLLEEQKGWKEDLESPNERLRSNIRDFWKDLCKTSININGHLVQAGSPYSGDRVIGALSRAILEFDKVENDQDFEKLLLKRANQQEGESLITEVEAVSFSRRILSGALRSTSRDDTLSAAKELFRNSDDVAFVTLESSEPLHIDVSFAGDDFSEDEPRPTEVAGWIQTKSKKSKNWKLRYFVVSEGVLSYFEWADPRPYGLRGQILLRDASIKTVTGDVLLIETDEKERQLRFEDRAHLIKWKSMMVDSDESQPIPSEIAALDTHPSTPSTEGASGVATESTKTQEESSITTNNTTLTISSSPPRRRTRSTEFISNSTSKSLKGVRGAGAKLKNAADEGVKVINRAKAHANRAAAQGMRKARNATGAGMKSIRTRTGMLMREMRRNAADGTERRRPTTDMLMTSTRNLEATTSGKREPSVQVVVEQNNVYKVMLRAVRGSTKNNEEMEEAQDEVLLLVRVKLYQAFLLSGGPSGRLASGDELLLMEFSKADGVEDIQTESLEPHTSL